MDIKPTGDHRPEPEQKKKILTILLSALGIVVVLSWAVATLFGLSLMKALAAVILVLFAVVVILLMSGIA